MRCVALRHSSKTNSVTSQMPSVKISTQLIAPWRISGRQLAYQVLIASILGGTYT